MNFTQTIIEALESIMSNKLRSGLTVLGIVIGVAAVIAMLAVGNGAQDSITGSISGIGTNLLFVFRGGSDNSIRNVKPLTLQDADALADPFAAPSVAAVSPVRPSCRPKSLSAVSGPINATEARPRIFSSVRSSPSVTFKFRTGK